MSAGTKKPYGGCCEASGDVFTRAGSTPHTTTAAPSTTTATATSSPTSTPTSTATAPRPTHQYGQQPGVAATRRRTRGGAGATYVTLLASLFLLAAVIHCTVAVANPVNQPHARDARLAAFAALGDEGSVGGSAAPARPLPPNPPGKVIGELPRLRGGEVEVQEYVPRPGFLPPNQHVSDDWSTPPPFRPPLVNNTQNCTADYWISNKYKVRCSPGLECVAKNPANLHYTGDLTGGNCVKCGPGKYCPDAGMINAYDLAWYHMCPKGNYCPDAVTKKPCPIGHYCPQGSFFRIPCFLEGSYCGKGSEDPYSPCPAGYYCPDPATKELCPEGFYCIEGLTKPWKCALLSFCPPGSPYARVSLAGVFFVVTVLVIVVIAAVFAIASQSSHQLKAALLLRQKFRRFELLNALIARSLNHTIDTYEFQGFKEIKNRVGIRFENLRVELSQSVVILNGVTGRFKAGRMVAIMGPSGCGKTTFLHALCGKNTVGAVTGKIFINNTEGSLVNHRKDMGFVPQDDIVHPNLTVLENLWFNAMLRLPANMPHNQKRLIVEDVLHILGLEAVSNVVVGDVEHRGISGGQRKRVNIGLELVACPSIIFLDEPTSGLDATAAAEVLEALRRLSRLGMNIIVVIHQPRYKIFKLFDDVLLMGLGGETVYLGASRRTLRYFEKLGFPTPEMDNPADWFMDIINGDVPRMDDPSFHPGELPILWAERGRNRQAAIDNYSKKRRGSVDPFHYEGRFVDSNADTGSVFSGEDSMFEDTNDALGASEGGGGGGGADDQNDDSPEQQARMRRRTSSESSHNVRGSPERGPRRPTLSGHDSQGKAATRRPTISTNDRLNRRRSSDETGSVNSLGTGNRRRTSTGESLNPDSRNIANHKVNNGRKRRPSMALVATGALEMQELSEMVEKQRRGSLYHTKHGAGSGPGSTGGGSTGTGGGASASGGSPRQDVRDSSVPLRDSRVQSLSSGSNVRKRPNLSEASLREGSNSSPSPTNGDGEGREAPRVPPVNLNLLRQQQRASNISITVSEIGSDGASSSRSFDVVEESPTSPTAPELGGEKPSRNKVRPPMLQIDANRRKSVDVAFADETGGSGFARSPGGSLIEREDDNMTEVDDEESSDRESTVGSNRGSAKGGDGDGSALSYPPQSNSGGPVARNLSDIVETDREYHASGGYDVHVENLGYIAEGDNEGSGGSDGSEEDDGSGVSPPGSNGSDKRHSGGGGGRATGAGVPMSPSAQTAVGAEGQLNASQASIATTSLNSTHGLLNDSAFGLCLPTVDTKTEAHPAMPGVSVSDPTLHDSAASNPALQRVANDGTPRSRASIGGSLYTENPLFANMELEGSLHSQKSMTLKLRRNGRRPHSLHITGDLADHISQMGNGHGHHHHHHHGHHGHHGHHRSSIHDDMGMADGLTSPRVRCADFEMDHFYQLIGEERNFMCSRDVVKILRECGHTATREDAAAVIRLITADGDHLMETHLHETGPHPPPYVSAEHFLTYIQSSEEKEFTASGAQMTTLGPVWFTDFLANIGLDEDLVEATLEAEGVVEEDIMDPANRRVTPSCPYQFGYLLRRSGIQFLRARRLIAFDWALLVLGATVVGLIYGSDYTIGSFLVQTLIANLTFSLFMAIGFTRVFGVERVNYFREKSAGINSFAYYCAKNVAMLPSVAIRPLLFLSLYYTFVVPRIPFLDYLYVMVALSWSASGLGIAISTFVAPRKAIVAAVILPMLIGGPLSGVSPTLTELRTLGVSWIADLSYGRWAVEALLDRELAPLPEYLEEVYWKFIAGDGWEREVFERNIFVMVGLGFFWRIIAYAGLLFVDRNQHK